MTWETANWPTTLRVVPTHMGSGDAGGRCWTVESPSEPRPFHLIAPETALRIGEEYEVNMLVLTERSDGIATARAVEIQAVVDVPDLRAALREMLR